MRVLSVLLVGLVLVGCDEQALVAGVAQSYCAFDDMALNGSSIATGETAYVFKFNQTDNRHVIAFFSNGEAMYYDPSNYAGTRIDGTYTIDDCVLNVRIPGIEFTVSDPTLGTVLGVQNALKAAFFCRTSDSLCMDMSNGADTLNWDQSPQYL